MCLAAARELAQVAEDKGLREDYIIPNMDEWEVFPREAVAVGSKAIEQGVARFNIPADERYKMAADIIKASRDQVQWMMKEGFIADPDK
jgi:malate dehydrogenase (oxaloacetate-decarboxylating)